MDTQKVVDYWQAGAKDALDTADKLIQVKKYHHALFFCHLAIEKALKALIVKTTGQSPLPIHDLTKLALTTNLKLTPEQTGQLNEITTFNVEARYDEYKLKFYKKATSQFAQNQFTITKNLLLWFQKL